MEQQPAARLNMKQEGGPAPVPVPATQQVRVKQEAAAKYPCVKYEEETSVHQPACSNLKQGKKDNNHFTLGTNLRLLFPILSHPSFQRSPFYL